MLGKLSLLGKCNEFCCIDTEPKNENGIFLGHFDVVHSGGQILVPPAAGDSAVMLDITPRLPILEAEPEPESVMEAQARIEAAIARMVALRHISPEEGASISPYSPAKGANQTSLQAANGYRPENFQKMLPASNEMPQKILQPQFDPQPVYQPQYQPHLEPIKELTTTSIQTPVDLPTARSAPGDNGKLEFSNTDLYRLERLVAWLAGSSLGCMNFEHTFRVRQESNDIVVLRTHSFDGQTFGDVCSTNATVTIIGLKFEDGKVAWAPANDIMIKSTDGVIAVKCTPFALAAGLASDRSLTAARPQREVPAFQANLYDERQFQPVPQQLPRSKLNRSCCGSADCTF